MKQWTVSVIILAATSGCLGAGEDATTDGGGMEHTGALLPWKPGNSWTYRVTDDDGVTTKETTISAAPEPVGLGPLEDTMAYRVIAKKSDGNDQTISWQMPLGDLVVRYREQSYAASTGQVELEEYWEPYKLHIDGSDEHTRAGAMWTVEYDESKVKVVDGILGVPNVSKTVDAWKVLNPSTDHVAITVPAGTFDDPVIIQKAGGSSLKTYWYVRGIGKVKESGGQTEELVKFTVSP
ncbi:MAG TPA: hypothetical protein VK540_19315 [Polyangiaceae bacterium]|nr:hypothetical protein [Polyangiaceae bacterium]